MTNNLEYVKKIIDEIDKDSPKGTQKAILNFIENVDIMGLFLLKKDFDNFNLLEYAAENKKWNAFLSCYTELSDINPNNPINDIKIVGLNILKNMDINIIKKFLNLIIKKCDSENLLLLKAIIELPKNIRDQNLKLILDTLKENNFDFNKKHKINRYYNTLLNEAIENPDWSNKEVELLLLYNNNIDIHNINIDRIAANPSKIEWLIKHEVNIYEDLSIPYYKNYFNVLIKNKNLTSETLKLILNNKKIDINQIEIIKNENKEEDKFKEKDVFVEHLINGNLEVCLTLLLEGKNIDKLINYKTSDILADFYRYRKDSNIDIQKKLLSELIKSQKLFDNDFSVTNLLDPVLSLYMMKDLNGENLIKEFLINKTISFDVFKSNAIRFCLDKYEVENLNSYIDMLQVFTDNEKNVILTDMLLALEKVNHDGFFGKKDMISNVLKSKSLLEQKNLESYFEKKINTIKIKQRL